MTILIIDDEPSLRRSLRAYLEDMDFDVQEAEDGQKGLDALAEGRGTINGVILDLNMPVMDGYSFLPQAVEMAPETPLIVLSGVGIVGDAMKAIRLGAWDFITKPLHSMDIVRHTLEKAFERARLIRENRLYQENLEVLVQQRTAEVEDTRRQIMQRLSLAAEYKDNETGHHVIRVGEISALLARELGLSEKRYSMLRDCAPLHDVGKLGIPDAILLKPGRLNSREWEIMQMHCVYGCQILGPLQSREEAIRVCSDSDTLSLDADNELLRLARMLALRHHERWDGSGYPYGIAGEAIPLEARIVTVVDVYDALRSERPYKKAFPEQKSLDIIRLGSGTQFDPVIADALIQNAAEVAKLFERWNG
jgi:putative two-component system response regulator